MIKKYFSNVFAIILILLVSLGRIGVHCKTNSKLSKQEPDVQDGKIIGGEEVTPHELPYQLGLFKNKTTTRPFCGAAIWNASFAITAAHCLVNTSLEDVMVLAGSHDLDNRNSTVEENRSIIKSHIHPDYNIQTNQNDIALLELSSPFTISSYIKSIEAPNSNDFARPNEIAQVSGWGLTKFLGNSSNILLKAKVRILDDSACQLVFDDYTPSRSICAEAAPGEPCRGDSGGPLVVGFDDGNPILVGIVSGGANCSGNTVYTDIAAYSSWLHPIHDDGDSLWKTLAIIGWCITCTLLLSICIYFCYRCWKPQGCNGNPEGQSGNICVNFFRRISGARHQSQA